MNAKRYLMTMIIVALLALAAPLLAAEEEAAAGAEIANGASLLVMLIGITAVAIVGGASLMRDQFSRTKDDDTSAAGR